VRLGFRAGRKAYGVAEALVALGGDVGRCCFSEVAGFEEKEQFAPPRSSSLTRQQSRRMVVGKEAN